MARVACLFSIEKYDTVDHPLHTWDKVPFGLSLIAACLERAGHTVRCWIATPDSDFEALAREMTRDFGCQIVAATAVTTQFPLVAKVCEEVKRADPSAIVLLGGVHASIRPQECIAHPAVDAICLGEGEEAAVAFADAIAEGRQPADIPGLWIKTAGGGAIDCALPKSFRNDLDDLPFVNYDHWERWVNPQDRTVHIVVGRGCPYSCHYCSNHAIRRVQPGNYVRFRSPANILSEMRMLLQRFPGLRRIYLEIETIGGSIPWALGLFEKLAAFNDALPAPIHFGANLAVTSQLVQDEELLLRLIQAFQRAHVTAINVGLESGSPRVRRDVLNRPEYTNHDLVKFSRLAREHGLAITLYLMMGVPTETPAEAVQTSQVARACDPHEIEPSIFYPYPGTQLHQLAQQLNLIDAKALGVTAERSRVYLKSKQFPRWRVFYEYILLRWRVFHGRKSSLRIARNMVSVAMGVLPGLQIASHRVMETIRSGRSKIPLHHAARP